MSAGKPSKDRITGQSKSVRIHVRGIVQGVGMRPFVYRLACKYGISGWVLNAGDGVHIEAQGLGTDVDAFIAALSAEAPAAARVEAVDVKETTGENPKGYTSNNRDDAPTDEDVSQVDARANETSRAIKTDATEASATNINRPDNEPNFRILASDGEGARTTLVSPDIATCNDCLRELFDPADRRYHYPFINCTNCGPRFTIIRSLPYDRTATSMRDFCMCAKCAAEYTDPADRRFHAQPNACFECGPHISWRELDAHKLASCSSTPYKAEPAAAPGSAFGKAPTSDGEPQNHPAAIPAWGRTRKESDAIIARCAELLAAGKVVAIKGLGGFHLACDASNETAVAELRRRKRRSNKPLAVMLRSVEDAEKLCRVSDTERELLAGAMQPIVLLRRREHGTCTEFPSSQATAASKASTTTTSNTNKSNSACEMLVSARSALSARGTAWDLAPSVAFDLPELGVMLPYTPLQHLIMEACEQRGIHALVMTSGNISEEPIETDDARAWEHLVEGGLADALLGNDREILTRFDDSVVRVTSGLVMPVRRARGRAPQPLPLPTLPGNKAPGILTCGPEQKATLAFTRETDAGAECFVSQHIGDVENVATFEAWQHAREHLAELFDLKPLAMACDLHPSYLTSQWARNAVREQACKLVEVQHHHAHIASVLAEAAVTGIVAADERVIGIAFDGTGAGGAYNTEGRLEPDGSIWGGEFLLASLEEFSRAAHLRTWCLPGAATAVRDARRNAFSLLYELGLTEHGGAKPLLASLSTEEQRIAATMIDRKINSPQTSSMGRLFDATAAILRICEQASYEGEPAIELEAAAWRGVEAARDENAEGLPNIGNPNISACTLHERPAGCEASSTSPSNKAPHKRTSTPLGTDAHQGTGIDASPLTIDTKPIIKKLLDGIARGEAPEALALGFHKDIAALTVCTAKCVRSATGTTTVALSGGVFMNRLLFMLVKAGLERAGFRVLVPQSIPVNDGCIAYGQAAVARARLYLKDVLL